MRKVMMRRRGKRKHLKLKRRTFCHVSFPIVREGTTVAKEDVTFLRWRVTSQCKCFRLLSSNRKRHDPTLSRRNGVQPLYSFQNSIVVLAIDSNIACECHLCSGWGIVPACVSGSACASGCEKKSLRFNIVSSHDLFTREPTKLKIGTPMPKLVQFTSFNN